MHDLLVKYDFVIFPLISPRKIPYSFSFNITFNNKATIVPVEIPDEKSFLRILVIEQ